MRLDMKLRNPIILLTLNSFRTSSASITPRNEVSLQDVRNLQVLKEQEPCYPIDPDLVYFCPVNRYCGWMENVVSNRAFFQDVLGYTRREWDYLARVNDEIEYAKFSALTEEQRSLMEFIGFNADSHDCCHGHYVAYDWAEFDDPKFAGVKAAWELLGYNEDIWSTVDLDSLIPPYGDMEWDDLPDEVQSAAFNDLCFNEELWNGITLTAWLDGTTLPGTFSKDFEGRIVSSAPSIVTTQIPTQSPTISPPDSPTISPTPSPTPLATDSPTASAPLEQTPLPTVGVTNKPSKDVSSSPSNLPQVSTPVPSNKPTMDVTLPPSTFQTPNPTFAPTIDIGFINDACHRLNPNMDYFCPVKRYCDFNYYDFQGRQFLRFQIGYDRITWNYYAIHRYETTKFVDLNKSVQDGLTIFAGFTEESHDCCHGHYVSYTWTELQSDTKYDHVLEALTTMGYDEDSWDAGTGSEYEGTNWDQLPSNIQEVLRNDLCYSRETWDKVPLDLWPQNAVLPGQMEKQLVVTESPTPAPTPQPTDLQVRSPAPTPAPCREISSDIDYFCPTQRYCEWNYFAFEQRQVLTFQLGYSGSEWNYESTNIIEETGFEDLNPFEKSALRDLGYNEDKHDCCLNHYTYYDWSDFTELEELSDVKEALELLGYNEEKWENDDGSDFDSFTWDELPPPVKSALYESLCYNKELWDSTPLTAWPEDVLLPGGSENLFLLESTTASSAHKSGIGIGLFGFMLFVMVSSLL